MKVLITGATGYVGGHIVDRLLAAGHAPRCLVRSPEKARRLVEKGAEIHLGDVTEPSSLTAALQGCDAVIHLVAIIEEKPRRGITFERLNFEATRNLADAAAAQGVHRFVHMSALGADPNGSTPYFRTKGKAEHYVRNSGLDFTIFRPSFIYGPGDAVYSMLAKVIKLSPFGLYPLFGDGSYRSQPVAVADVAQGFVNALTKPASVGKTYDVGGPEALSFREQLRIIGRVIGKRVRFVPSPLALSRLAVGVMQLLPFSPIDLDRLTMLTTDNVCDPLPFSQTFGIELTPFESGIAYLRR